MAAKALIAAILAGGKGSFVFPEKIRKNVWHYFHEKSFRNYHWEHGNFSLVSIEVSHVLYACITYFFALHYWS